MIGSKPLPRLSYRCIALIPIIQIAPLASEMAPKTSMPSFSERTSAGSPLHLGVLLFVLFVSGSAFVSLDARSQDIDPALTDRSTTTGQSNTIAKSLIVKSLTARRLGRLDEALAYAESASAVSPDDPSILSLLSELHHDNGDPDSALYFARQALSLSTELEYFRQTTNLLMELKRIEEAGAVAERFVKVHPANATALSTLATAMIASGDTAEAKAALDAVPTEIGNNVDLLERLVGLSAQAGSSRGIEIAEQLIAINPHDSGPRVAQLHLLQALGRTAEFERALEDAMRLHPQSSELASLAAGSVETRGNPASVASTDLAVEVRAVLMTLPIDRDRLTALVGSLSSRQAATLSSAEIDALGSALLHLARLEEAKAVLLPALQADVSSEHRWALVSEAHRRSGALKLASLTCGDGLLFFPGSVRILVECAMTAASQENMDAAVGHITDAVRFADESPPLNPEEAQLEIVAGLIDALSGQRERSLSRLSSALRLNPSSGFIVSTAARIYSALGDRDEAILFSGRALELDPLSDEVQSTAARIYFEQGMYQESISLLEKLTTVYSENPALFGLLGDAESAAGNKNQARSAYARAAALEPTNEVIKRKLDELQ